MRLWSIHPKYLDTKGLVACWREALLAKDVLIKLELGKKPKGYSNHPQLIRFKNYKNPIQAIGWYLHELYNEACERKFKFDSKKINIIPFPMKELPVTQGQLEYEMNHLQEKLKKRNFDKFTSNLYEVYNKNMEVVNIKPHPLFKIIKGEIEPWEKII